MKECLNYRKIDSGAVECGACAHYCRIGEGRTGICGIRQNNSGRLELLAYGRAVALNVDPIEKKPLFHFLPGSRALSFGTLGCNFRCANCQNYDISQMYDSKGQTEKYPEMDWGRALQPEEIVTAAIKNKCASIAYTYNEPTTWMEYALDTMKLASKKGIKNVWVSNGYMTEKTIELIVPYLDAINVDIKSYDEKFYRDNCGVSLAPVLESCRMFVKEKIWLEVTTLIIPTLSDDEAVLRNLAGFIRQELGADVPWHVSAFSGGISWKLGAFSDTPVEKVRRAYTIGKEAGLNHVYAGNVPEKGLEDTFCPKCQQKVVDRIGYSVDNQLRSGKCPHCRAKIAGIF